MIKNIIHTLSGILPGLFVKLALEKLSNPQVRKLRERELAVLSSAEQRDIDYKDFTIKTYHWKGPKETILLIHGWEGQAGNFADLIKRLIPYGYNIIAFDGPSHGLSSQGKTSLFEFADLVGELIVQYEAKRLISHSFGGVATTYALFKNQNIQIEKYGLFTTPDKFSERIEDVTTQYGINKKVTTRLIRKLEMDNDIKVNDLNVSDFVKVINVKESMIIHDKFDKVLPIVRSINVSKNWKQSIFVDDEKSGHFGILRDDFALSRMIEFIK